MFFKKLVKGTINVVGTVSKVGVEIGADIVGIVAEKVNDDPSAKEKYSEEGKKIGKKIKNISGDVAETCGNVTESAIKYGVNTLNTVKDSAIDAIEKNKTRNYSTYKSHNSNPYSNFKLKVDPSYNSKENDSNK